MRRSRPLFANLAIAFLIVSLAARALSAQEAAPTSGWFHIIWRDAERGPAGRSEYYVLIDDAGRWWDLDLDPALVRQADGALSLDRKRVTVAARVETPALGARVPRLRVRSVRLDQARRDARAMVSADAAPAVSGSRPYVTILCKFADATAITPATVQRMQQVMGSTYPGMDHYYREMSGDLANLQGSVVVGWYTLPQPRSYYILSGGANLSALSQDCTAAADPDVNFANFSGINLQFNQRLDCCSWGGSRVLTLDGVTRVYPMTWMADWAIGHSVYGHEIGHSFGWPHSHGSYGATYDSKWDVMSSSYNFRDQSFGWIGVHTIAFHKDRAGWIAPARKFIAPASGTTTILLERGALPNANGNYLMAQIAIPGSTSYYTVETRRVAGNYDRYLPGEAVIIHKIVGGEANVVDPDLNGNPNDAGAQWVPGETFVDSAAKLSVAVEAVVGDAARVTIETGIDVLALAVSPSSRRDSAVAGSTATLDDSATVTLSGPSAASTGWTVTNRRSWNTLVTAGGTGNGQLRWRRDPLGLAPGTYVDTIAVAATGASGSPALVIDTLRVTAPPGVLTLTVSPLVRRDSVVTGATAPRPDSATVTLSGMGAATAGWSATASAGWVTMTAASGTGSGRVRWTRDPTGLAVGTYVDTILVSAAGASGSPARIVDTLRVLPLPAPLVISLGMASRRDSVMAHSTRLRRDSVTVIFTGSGAASASWSATNRGSWIAIATPTGNGAGQLRWTRDAAGLVPGTYVDTLVVTASGALGSPAHVVDTLRVLAPPSVEDAAAELLGTPRLTGFQKQYLDQEGNANAAYDLGDLLAFLDRSGVNLNGPLRAALLGARQEHQ
jgi:hypothetical protein